MKYFRESLTIAAFAIGVMGASIEETRAINHPITEKSNNTSNTEIQPVTVLMVNPQQQNLIGTVTAIDMANGKIIVKTDAGNSVTFSTNDKTAVRRLQPGQTSIANAEKITLAAIKVGDRVLVPGGAADAQTAARQVIVMASEAIAAKRDQDRSEWQTRGINGRITALNQEKKEITVQARGAEIITVKAPGNAKILRYAPDSLRSTDARTGAFTDLRIGDQIRILGNRSADGKIVTAEEIVSGTVARAFGTITDINTKANEITIKNSQTGQTFTVVIGKNSVVKRLPAEVAQNLAQRRERRQQRRQTQAESTGAQTENQGQRRRERRNGENRERRPADASSDAQRPRGGLQQMLEAQPAITIADLKKGDALMVTGTQGADASRLIAVNIISGDAELMQLMQRTQRGRNGNMSPGLPGNVGGGNVSDDDEP
ncbi:MAG TPA: hypothetical protein VGB02_05885 [Pyrinomonadaceae bacterium]|jgi:hypothetical protein